MPIISSALDIFYTYRFIRILTQSWKDTDAYKMDIIDENGNILIKRSQLRTNDEKKAYSLFHRLVWKLKRLLEKAPGGSSKVASYAAALWLIKEHSETLISNSELIVDSFEEEFQHTFVEDANAEFEKMFEVEYINRGAYMIESNSVSFILNEPLYPTDSILGENIYVYETNNQRLVFTKGDVLEIYHEEVATNNASNAAIADRNPDGTPNPGVNCKDKTKKQLNIFKRQVSGGFGNA